MEYVKGGEEKLEEANTSHVQLDEAIADVNTISSSPLHNSDQPIKLIDSVFNFFMRKVKNKGVPTFRGNKSCCLPPTFHNTEEVKKGGVSSFQGDELQMCGCSVPPTFHNTTDYSSETREGALINEEDVSTFIISPGSCMTPSFDDKTDYSSETREGALINEEGTTFIIKERANHTEIVHQNKERVDVFVNMENKLEGLSPTPSEFCVFKVHEQLRVVNEKAYEPNIIAIGPYHRGKSSLQAMEEHKLRYLQFRIRQKNDNLQRYIDAMRELVGDVRRCYTEPLGLNDDELIEMMLLDGFFIIEFFRKFGKATSREKNDPIFQVKWIVNCLQRDLLLFENQLPIFLLCKLFDMIKSPGNHSRFNFLAFKSFPIIFLRPENFTLADVDAVWQQNTKNLVGLVHNNIQRLLGPVNTDLTKKERKIRFIPSVTKLREAGIKFETIQGATNSFEVIFDNGVMKIPTLTIEDRTESFFRNLMAYEEYHQSTQDFRFIMDYVKFMNCLIDTPKDVAILCRRQIIDNWLGDDEAVSTMFNKLNDYITGPDENFYYAGTFDRVNDYYIKTLPRCMAKLRRDYFSSPWAIISVFAAFVLFALTILQTVYTVMG